MDPSPLVTEQVDAGAAFLNEFEKYAPVKVAFWLRDADGGDWKLYVASDQIDDSNFDVAYGEVLRVVNRLRNPYLDPFQVKFVWGNDPTVRAALDVHRRFPRPLPTRINGQSFGGRSAAGVYIYLPKPQPVTA